MKFVRSRNSKSFKECIGGTRDPLSLKLARSQDKIGWRRFMEGMISKEFCRIQDTGDSASSGENACVWCKVGTDSVCQTPGDDARSMAGEELLNP